MILDERTEFADATALNTGAPGAYLVGDVVDLVGLGTGVTVIGNAVTVYPAQANPLYLVIQVDTAVTSGAAASVSFSLMSDSTADLATSPTTHLVTAEIPKATLVAGYRVCAVPLPAGAYERYLGIKQLTVTTALTAGKVNAFLTSKPGAWVAAPDNVT